MMDKIKNGLLLIVMTLVIIGSGTLLSLPKTSSVSAKESPQVSKSCADMIQGYVNWAQKSPKNLVYGELVVTSVKSRTPDSPAVFTGWAPGRMEAKGDGIDGVFQEYFSDRTDGRQPFAHKKSEFVGVNISSSAGVTLTLHSWGNGKATYTDLTCPRDGFIMFKSPTPGWEAVYMIALVKITNG